MISINYQQALAIADISAPYNDDKVELLANPICRQRGHVKVNCPDGHLWIVHKDGEVTDLGVCL